MNKPAQWVLFSSFIGLVAGVGGTTACGSSGGHCGGLLGAGNCVGTGSGPPGAMGTGTGSGTSSGTGTGSGSSLPCTDVGGTCVPNSFGTCTGSYATEFSCFGQDICCIGSGTGFGTGTGTGDAGAGVDAGGFDSGFDAGGPEASSGDSAVPCEPPCPRTSVAGTSRQALASRQEPLVRPMSSAARSSPTA